MLHGPYNVKLSLMLHPICSISTAPYLTGCEERFLLITY